MSDDKSITVSRTISAPVERVFALLADPDRHPDIDDTGAVRHSRSHFVISGVGEVFTMDMHDERLGGDYRIDNLVTTYVRDQAIGWSPGLAGKDPIGHTFTYTLTPRSDDSTSVSQTYDWSGVSRELPLALPVVSREQLERSLQLLADAL
jgi:uncharacterized protein YndB with AHSA1/START domain